MLPTELQEYLDEHQVERMLKELLAALLFTKPSEPLDFMVQCLEEIRCEKAKGSVRLPQMNFKDVFMKVAEDMKKGAQQQSSSGMFASDGFAAPNEGRGSDGGLFSSYTAEGFAPSEEMEVEDEEDVGELPMPSHKAAAPGGKLANLRRGSVSAESFKPTDEEYEKVVIPKSEEAKKRIENSVSKQLLFRNLEVEQRNEIIDAMFEKKVPKGVSVIRQGDEGDNFYVVDSGAFDIFVNGTKVVESHPGDCFGELALMYNTPRAATVTATEDSVLWATDRVTFRRIVTNNMYRKRKLYENFLRTVQILKSLNDTEVTKVADALEPVEYRDGDDIVCQGAEGDTFYILLDGEAKVTITKDGGEPHEMMRYHSGDYFGEIALINNSPRAATVTAVGHCKCVSLNRAAFIRLLGPVLDILKRNMDDYKKYEEYDQQ